jgi:opacity protein-like surface antigen
MDVSLGVFGQLTPSRTPTETITQSAGTSFIQSIQGTSASAGVLGTFHQSFGRWLGYSVNLGYSRFTENYSQGTEFIPNPSYVPHLNPTSSFARGSIGTNMYELTGAYLVQGPRAKHFDTFAQLGGGVLSFLPTQDPSPYAVQFRPTMVFGAGMNYKLSKHWGLRAEYRGLFLKNPDFNGERGIGSVPTSKLFTVTNEPTISIVYRFGGKR